MYETFYGLKERPFNLTPDPHYLYLSEKHREALAHLRYGITTRSGFIMITGEVGTGKTTICRNLLDEVGPDTEISFIFNPCLSQRELLKTINEDFGIESRGETVKDLVDELNHYLLSQRRAGKNCVLVIDEAQDLSPQVLEQIRLLSNLETEKEKLLQVVLIGQPELGQMLAMPELRQLNQRITARYHLRPLSKKETLMYVAYRLRMAGGRKKVQFTRQAVDAVYKFSKGTPRLINALCDRALLVGFTLEKRDITKPIVKRAAQEIAGERFSPRRKPSAWGRLLPIPAVAVAAVLVLVAAQLLTLDFWPDRQSAMPVERPVPRPADVPKADAVVHEEVVEAKDKPLTLSQFEAKLADLPTDESLAEASAGILRAWNMAFVGQKPEGPSLAQIERFIASNGLSFEALTPTVRQLAVINLPAFVRLAARDDYVWMALLGLDDTTATLTGAAGETLTVERGAFTDRFVNQAVLPWRDPSPDASLLAPGAQGTAVRNLQDLLRRAGRYSGDVSGYLDNKTAFAIGAVQAEAGLNADGIAGRQTRMLFSSWSPDVETPALHPAPHFLEGLVDTRDAVAARALDERRSTPEESVLR